MILGRAYMSSSRFSLKQYAALKLSSPVIIPKQLSILHQPPTKMKTLAFLSLAATTAALPSSGSSLREYAGRQAAEACPLGYCVQNGGTTGGANATPIVVSDLAQLKQASSSHGPAVIIVSGRISAPVDTVSITSDKTIFGEPRSGEPLFSYQCFIVPKLAPQCFRIETLANMIQ